ncbi:Neutral ceramidase B [Paragonimus heterotremus]|uniref:Neutral ceramidase n=1 Tax=Paragonimus heterotremus TaxID=100268 RepID=A0A8J4T3E7_9TREM|nr:Neutral ceramidase B [Paragonimus heterotremus]
MQNGPWPLFVMFSFITVSADSYRFGVGIYDITGAAAEVVMMGYAKFSQSTSGIHTRLFSRAFCIQNTAESRPILFINVDLGMSSQLLKTKVIDELAILYGKEFDAQNVLISATHTHSGPGGYFQYFLYLISTVGFVKENFEATVQGIVYSVRMAKQNMMNGTILINQGELLNASINRSPTAYLNNPKEERDKYTYDVDTKMTLLKFIDSTGRPVAMLNWFAVHATSMNNTNTLISGDNKGLASLLFEQKMNAGRQLGQGPFIAAFAQANEGDVSPNINGPRCIDTGEPCDMVHSTCDGRSEKCIAFGPGKDMFESTLIIARRQVEKAWELFTTAKDELTGPVNFVHQFVDMPNTKVTYKGRVGSTCLPAMGYSFAAGTMDGPGDFDFTQGTTKGTAFWDFIRDLVHKPSPDLQKCHFPKPILLGTGELSYPWEWQPMIVETQLLRIGSLIIVGLPGEFTTMSGRRINAAVQQSVEHYLPKKQNKSWSSGDNFVVVLAGLSNVYSSYVTTPEEYELQRYEGASTIYGPLTLPAYVGQYEQLAAALINGSKLPPGPKPPFHLTKLFGLLPPVLLDTAPWRRKFGDVLLQPLDTYSQPNDVVHVHFVSANPRNDFKQNGTFLTVDRYDEDSHTWLTEFTDANWETKFHWRRSGSVDWLLGQSMAEISWQVSNSDGQCRPGRYRIQHFGTAKPSPLSSRLRPFTGISNTFKVTCNSRR